MQFVIIAINPYLQIELHLHLIWHILNVFDQKSDLANLDINSWFEFYNPVVFVHWNHEVLTWRSSSEQHIFSICVNDNSVFTVFLYQHVIFEYYFQILYYSYFVLRFEIGHLCLCFLSIAMLGYMIEITSQLWLLDFGNRLVILQMLQLRYLNNRFSILRVQNIGKLESIDCVFG